ncbi:unnamed protein product [Arctogadus glacialis]
MTVVSPYTQDLMDCTHSHAVLSKLNDLRSEGLFCDVTIVVEDVKFRAHRNILAACSGYFRNALIASQSWSSSQVLELVDLKSEVFASILNFIYSSKVASAGADETRGLVAAGKRLGIPFLEKLSEPDRQSSTVSKIMRVRGVMNIDPSQGPAPKNTKKEPSRPVDINATTGPRITNAFSITEVGPGNNPFTPLVPTDGERKSPDVGQVLASCPIISCLTATNEPPHALSEHSYAVIQTEEQKDRNPKDCKMGPKSSQLQTKQLAIQNIGPLKKRHRLRGTLERNTTSTKDSQQSTDIPDANWPVADSSPTGVISYMTAVVIAPPPLNAEPEPEKNTDDAATTDNFQMEFEPPTLSPHVEDSISIYGCEYCPEIFTNNALLTLHMEVHKRRFVSHLFCKFCDRKFMHLKRLRNHEHGCLKAIQDPPETDPVETLIMDIHSDDVATMDKQAEEVPPDDPHSPCIPEPDQNNPSEARQGMARVEKTGGSQRVYNCSVCKRVYITLSSLKRHENVHSWQRAYPCHYCNKVFALAEYRTKHEIWHTGERRYQCIFCLETFMTYYILKNHQKAFHGIDPRLAVKKKSAKGGFKASVYPIKLYRLLPMKFRKKRYKTYSETYGDSVESTMGENNSLITPSEENSNPEPGSFNIPMTFMATTKTVAPVTPHINFKQPLEPDIDSDTTCRKRDYSKDVEHRSSHPLHHNHPKNLQTETTAASCDENTVTIMNMDHFSRNIPFLTKTLKTVNKLGELSAAAKRVEAMTKEILLSGTDSLKQGKAVCSRKTETYLAKPVCPGPSVDGDALPLCQITVKIGNEAIIRRQIKGSNLFPRKRKKSRQRETPGEWFSTEDSSGSARLQTQMEISAVKEAETYEDPNDHEAADKSWRPYYSYKAKKKKKKMRFKHRKDQQYFLPPTSVARAPAKEGYPERRSLATDNSTSANSTDTQCNIRNRSPRASYKCDICDSSFITKSGLRAHVIGSHPCFCRTCGEQGPPGEVPAGGDYVCNNCMESGSCFDNTPQRCSTEKKYHCSFCPQRFLYLATKRSHERKHQELGNGKGYKYNKCPPRSKHATQLAEDGQHTIKSEEDDEEVTHLRCNEEGTGTSTGNTAPKMEGKAGFPSVATKSFQEPHSKTKDLLSSSNSDSVFPELPTKVKYKMSKKRMDAQDSLHLPSKMQAHERDNSRGLLKRPKTLHEKHPHLLWKQESVKKGISICKTEQWVCKQEPVFEGQ